VPPDRVTRASSATTRSGGEVERTVREGQRRPVSLHELRVRQGAFPRECEQLRNRIEPDDLAHERRQGEREGTGARADVEGALVPPRSGELSHLCREPRRPGVLPRGNTLGRASEAVS
jgi:hypothetical protein